MQELTTPKNPEKKKGRPAGFTPQPKPPSPLQVEEDGDYVLVRLPKKLLAKLLLKDLL